MENKWKKIKEETELEEILEKPEEETEEQTEEKKESKKETKALVDFSSGGKIQKKSLKQIKQIDVDTFESFFDITPKSTLCSHQTYVLPLK